MNQLQEEIAKALVQLSEKSLITEAVLAKKIRENIKFDGKNKAGFAFRDVEEAIYFIEKNTRDDDKELHGKSQSELNFGGHFGLHFALHLNSANDLLIKQADSADGLDSDARKRRLASEKAMSILTNGDVKKALEVKKGSGKNVSGPKPYKKRTDKKRLNVNRNYDDYE